jgi:hypothetical protein
MRLSTDQAATIRRLVREEVGDLRKRFGALGTRFERVTYRSVARRVHWIRRPASADFLKP